MAQGWIHLYTYFTNWLFINANASHVPSSEFRSIYRHLHFKNSFYISMSWKAVNRVEVWRSASFHRSLSVTSDSPSVSSFCLNLKFAKSIWPCEKFKLFSSVWELATKFTQFSCQRLTFRVEGEFSEYRLEIWPSAILRMPQQMRCFLQR